MQEQEMQGTQPLPAADGEGARDKVQCFVSKRAVDREQAEQVEHPREGLVWVASEYIKS